MRKPGAVLRALDADAPSDALQRARAQDSLLAARLMTRRDTFLTRRDFMAVCMRLEGWNGDVPPPAVLKPQALWTGKQAFSLLFAKQDSTAALAYRGTSGGHDDQSVHERPDFSFKDTRVLIRDRVLLTGILDKHALGASGGGLIHILFNDQARRAHSGVVIA